MAKLKLTDAERVVADSVLHWAKKCTLIRIERDRKLLQVKTPDDEAQYYSIMGGPQPRLIFHEPVWFVVSVHEARGECRAGHKIGDRWDFAWSTPTGMCGSAYHAMYPVLHGLMLTSGRYSGPAAHETLVACPDHGWLVFRIERRRWNPEDW